MLSTRIKEWQQEIEITSREKGLEQGREEGLEEGREEGRQEGRILGERIGEAKFLKKMLNLKFGELPAWAIERIDQADADLLDRWLEHLLDAKQLEDIFQ